MLLILGIGNDILKDDGIGIKLVDDLRKRELPEGTHCKTTLLGGLEILEIIKDYEQVIIIDAIKTVGGNPGDIHLYDPAEFRNTLHLSNLHDISFLTSLDLARTIGIRVTEAITIIAVEIVEDREFGTDFSPEIQKKYPEIRRNIYNHILRIMNQSSMDNGLPD